MRIVLIADSFPPMRSSGAVQIRDLVREFTRQGHSLCLLLPSFNQREPWVLEDYDGAQVLRLKAPRIKDIGYVRRTLAELVMPIFMLRNLRRSPLAQECWEGVVWYSPSIFHGPLIGKLKKSSGCKSYLIVRDIFPEWAVDMGLMRRSLPYLFFSLVARYQYSLADVIGVQSPGNAKYFPPSLLQPSQVLEVLQNWLGKVPKSSRVRCSIRVDQTDLNGRKIFVYAGNMGVAQGLDILMDLADKLRCRDDVGFLFVGRGSDVARLKAIARERQLDSVLFFDEIDPDEIPDLYYQCDAGIVSLDSRHKSHNIPGKFLTYMQIGLPVLANLNRGNDLAGVVNDERVGQVCESNDLDELLLSAERLLAMVELDSGISERCLALFEREFAVENSVKQIVAALSVNETNQPFAGLTDSSRS